LGIKYSATSADVEHLKQGRQACGGSFTGTVVQRQFAENKLDIGKDRTSQSMKKPGD